MEILNCAECTQRSTSGLFLVVVVVAFLAVFGRQDILAPILGSQDGAAEDGKDHPSAAALRRLHFESHQMSMMELKRIVEAKDDLAPRQLSQTERESQRFAFNSKSLGIKCEGRLEPVQPYWDGQADMVQKNQFKPQPWKRIGSGEYKIFFKNEVSTTVGGLHKDSCLE